MDIRKDPRNRDPQGTHRRAFMAGWTDAAHHGTRYATIDTKKTHQNMGNLFGWIFGPKDEAFRDKIWSLYLEHALDIEEE
jgi:hypothetical protein